MHPYFHIRMITLVNINGFSPNWVCALILWRPSLGLLMGEFCLFLTELSAHDTSVFSFLNDNFFQFLDRVIILHNDNGEVLSFHVLFTR